MVNYGSSLYPAGKFAGDILVSDVVGEGLIKVGDRILERVKGLKASQNILRELPSINDRAGFREIFDENHETRPFAKTLWRLYQKAPEKFENYNIVQHILRQERFTKTSSGERIFYGYFKTSGETYPERIFHSIFKSVGEVTSPGSSNMSTIIYNTIDGKLGMAFGKIVYITLK